MDEVFGEHNFKNHIAWGYQRWWTWKTKFANKHDDILRYSKTWKWIFNEGEMREAYTTKDVMWHNNEKWKLLRDVREDIPIINTVAKERVGYPTQKPEKLLERIIRASSNKWDIVLDAFSWSWTTIATAEKLWRKRIWIDSWKLAIYTQRHMKKKCQIFLKFIIQLIFNSSIMNCVYRSWP